MIRVSMPLDLRGEDPGLVLRELEGGWLYVYLAEKAAENIIGHTTAFHCTAAGIDVEINVEDRWGALTHHLAQPNRNTEFSLTLVGSKTRAGALSITGLLLTRVAIAPSPRS